jgi:hypothetical protein
MGRTACTEPQCLYKGAHYLYLYPPYGPYGLYRASEPVQGCTLPLPLLPLWAVRPVQSFSVCTRVTFTFTFYFLITSRKRYCPSRSARSDKQGRAAATNTFDVDTIWLTIKTVFRQPQRYVPEATRMTIKRPHVKGGVTESAVSFNINET